MDLIADLPAAWTGHAHWVVLDTDFDRGDRFLALWATWQADPQRCERLTVLSAVSQPLSRAAFEPLPGHAWPRHRDALLAQWPVATPDLHTLEFEGGRLRLLLGMGRAWSHWRSAVARVDAFLLTTPQPSDDPLQARRHAAALARLAAPGASLHSGMLDPAWHAALRTAGFQPDSAGELDPTPVHRARFAPRHPVRRAPARTPPAAPPARVVVIGAGLAGCATVWALARLGVRTTLVDGARVPAAGASGTAAGLYHGIVTPSDGPHARFNRAAALRVQQVIGASAGVLRLHTRPGRVEALQAVIAHLGLPADYVRAVDGHEAARLSGLRVSDPAWFYPGGGWIDPRDYTRSLLREAGAFVTWRPDTRVAALHRCGAAWALHDGAGECIDVATHVVVATASEATRLLAPWLPSAGAPGDWALQCVRGQTSALRLADAAAAGLPAPLRPVAGSGYVVPPHEGAILFGATAQPGDADPRLRADDHARNLRQLERLAGWTAPSHGSLPLGGRVGFRAVAPDRLPLIGQIPDLEALAAPHHRATDQPRFVPRCPGLYVYTGLASRGITWSALGAEILAALLTGTPCPVDADLLDAVDVGRFAARATRRPPRPSSGAGAGERRADIDDDASGD